MNKEERDNLLIRLDQKVQDSLPKIEKHLEKINGHLDDHYKRILTMEVSSKTSKKLVGGYITGALAVLGLYWKSYFG